MLLWWIKHDKVRFMVAHCARKRDEVSLRVPFQQRKQEAEPYKGVLHAGERV